MGDLNISELSDDECMRITGDSGTSESVLMELVYYGDRRVVVDAFRNPSMPVWFLRSMLLSERPELRMLAVSDVRLSLETVVGAVADEDRGVLRALAGRHDLSPELMWVLACHPSFEVAHTVGRRSGVPVEVGVMLTVGRMSLGLETVRPEAVGNDLFPFKIFGLWLKDKNETLLQAGAGELPLELVLEWFAEQGDKVMVNNYYMKYVERALVPNIRVYVEAETGIMALPDAWVVRMFRTLVGEF